jgi:hypothetical protein
MNEPKLFSAYQSAHYEREEKQLTKAKYLAAFIGQSPGKATFMGALLQLGCETHNLPSILERP